MSYGNLGPKFMWIVLFTCAIIGVFSSIYFIAKGAIWLYNNIQIL